MARHRMRQHLVSIRRRGRGTVRLALVTLGLAASGCAQSPSTLAVPVPDPCTGPGAETAGWVMVDAGPFRFSAPPEYRRQEVHGIDSYVGEWSASRRRLVSFDWGMYSWTMDDAGSRLQGYRECRLEIGGHPATVVNGYDAAGQIGAAGAKYVVAATWRDVSPGTHLTLVTASADAADLPALLTLVRSIRFDRE